MPSSLRTVFSLGFILLLAGCGSNLDVPWSGSDPTPTPTPGPAPGEGPEAVWNIDEIPPDPGWIVYQSDFESSDGGFTVAGSNPSWAWDIPTDGPAAPSGVRIWGTNPGGNYNDSEDSCAVSPPLALPEDQNIELTWSRWYDTEACCDEIEARVNNGMLNSLETDRGSSGTTYDRQIADLTAFAGETVTLEFCLDTDDSITDEGHYFDDVLIVAR